MNKRHHFSFIALLEPFQDPDEIEVYKRGLGFDNAMANSLSKIWIFWREQWTGHVTRDTHQQITLKFLFHNKPFYITSVYSRCTETDRMELWEEIEELASGNSDPWIVGGDFNVILNAEEKLGGLPFTHSEAADFAHCVNNSALVELPTTGSKFTW